MIPDANKRILVEFSAKELERIGKLAVSGELVDMSQIAQLLDLTCLDVQSRVFINPFYK